MLRSKNEPWQHISGKTTVVVEETKVAIEGIIVADEETTSELMPMMAQSCSDYSNYDGNTFDNTSQGQDAMGISYSGKGLGIVLLTPMLDIRFSQCGTDLCVFITNSKGRQLSWFKVKQW